MKLWYLQLMYCTLNTVTVGAHRLLAHAASYLIGFAGSFHGVKRPSHDVNHRPPLSAEVEIEWSYACTLPICLSRSAQGQPHLFSLFLILFCFSFCVWDYANIEIVWTELVFLHSLTDCCCVFAQTRPTHSNFYIRQSCHLALSAFSQANDVVLQLSIQPYSYT